MRTLLALTLIAVLSACTGIPYRTSRNQELTGGDCGGIVQTVSPLGPQVGELPPTGVYVGLALSGGGSRAAIFSTAVLEQLAALDIMPHVNTISAVSGGAVAAAYYALYQPRTPGQWLLMRAAMEHRFRTRWMLAMARPDRLALLHLTNYDRSDVMAGVFDRLLFHGATFGDLPSRPRLLLNATANPGRVFTFSPAGFLGLGSRLDRYPLAMAVMASAAFPGVFNNVTLRDYSHGWADLESWNVDPCNASRWNTPPRYLHLHDGGATDNLGIETLLGDATAMAWRADQAGRPLRACLVVVVDADIGTAVNADELADTRRGLDYLIDRNVFDAIGSLMGRLRGKTLAETVGRPLHAVSPKARVWETSPQVSRTTCMVWHIVFDTLPALAFEAPSAALTPQRRALLHSAWVISRGIETDFDLSGMRCPPTVLATTLRATAYAISREDTPALRLVCGLLGDLAPACGLPAPPLSAAVPVVPPRLAASTFRCHPPGP